MTRAAPRNKELTEEEVEEYYTCWSFTKRSWKILAFVLWLVLVLITTETYQALRTPPEHHDNEVPKELWAT